MTVPDVSVIIIGYNDAAHLPAAVNSVLAQTHRNIEVIISDDHSTDATPEVVAAFVTQDHRVRSHRRVENSGAPGGPLNDGLELATGRYVMFLGSDDDLPPHAVAAHIAEADRSGADIVSGLLVRVLRNEGDRRVPWFPDLHTERRYGATIADLPAESQDTLTTNKMYRREFLERIGARFPEGMLYEDVVFSAHTLAEAQGIVQIPDEVYHWNVYPPEERQSITNQRRTRKNLEDRLRALDLAEAAFVESGEDVRVEFDDKVLAHHLRFYLNDFLEADDEWCGDVLKMIRPRLERTSFAAYERRFLGDRLLYAAALEGDVRGVRSVLRGKLGGALAGRFFAQTSASFWAPRDPESRPSSTSLARKLSSMDGVPRVPRSHSDLMYLHAIQRVETDDRTIRLTGWSTDPIGVLREPGSRLSLFVTHAGIRQQMATAHATTDEGVSWVAEVAIPQAVCGTHVSNVLELTALATSARGELNHSPVQALGQEEWKGTEGKASQECSRWDLRATFHGPAMLVARAQAGSKPTAPRVVVIGDVSWNGRYHLGDEAMTEAAISQLRERGCEITVVAGEPAVTQEQYSVDAVPSFGFVREKTRAARERRLETLVAGARGRAELSSHDALTVAAIKNADAVIVAGGGNLNSSGSQHIFERVALKRIAESVGVPLFVSSQTVGPLLVSEDRPLVRELLAYATAFGARERASAALMREIGAGIGNVVRTLDDALLLQPVELSGEQREALGLPERYVVGSFTFHAYSTGLSREEYYRDLARIVDDIVKAHDVHVILLPHMGVLGMPEQMGRDNDVYGHDRVVHYAQSGRVRSLPMISAREVLAVTMGAEYTVSTRYHPLVFGAAVGVPAIGLVTSYYSALRMRGALAAFGVESLALPFEYWTSVLGAPLLEALSLHRDQLAAHVSGAGAEQRAFQSRWWDAIVQSIRTHEPVSVVDAPEVDSWTWGGTHDKQLLAMSRVAHEATNMYRMNNLVNVEDHAARITQMERAHQLSEKSSRREADQLRRELDHLRAEFADLADRARPPGARTRDRIRLALQRLRRR
ncbi:polysaccharide pyruvyl transferase family protein [Leucobacter chromiireducens]|uniref:Glycosyltransferase n=1 Tax=Leucobacter chromiireducens subsp. solipictus TaxID=398235 RepID=A0ABS1SGU1_9MICO|nr:polysaccharide pyruvyl transferase family protein [Leucobacter chromiireducens]MBL3679797.1 glycosyltransferase [Leucobacter chromiireducens subsp. solipictus]